ncbi:uncharacterized protein [Diadema setosum]|uniref:uncharacterized protein n=1 Tax=Diadema setosum TaxID=31175 RepID=UPI003B3A50EA
MGRNLMIICLVAVSLLNQHSGKCVTTRSPDRTSCDTKCTYLQSTREANCENRQLSEVPMECNAASYLSLHHNQIERIEPGTFEGFSDLQVLILSNNRIGQVEANTFTGAPKLQVIYLQSNNLEIFDRLALNGTNSDLGVINLSHNNIKDIETGTFQFVIKLRLIVLYNNSLSSLRPGVFDNLRQLTSLQLGRNKLKTLTEFFTHLSQLQMIILSDNQLISVGGVLLLPRITTLDMRNNNLTKIDNLKEETLDRLQVFLLEGNPWKCDCQLETLRLWYSRLDWQGDHRAYIDSPTCYEPPSLAKQPINGMYEGFCPNFNFSFTTDSSKSTKGSFHETNNTPSPDTSKPKSPGKSYLKALVPVILILLALTIVSISSVLKLKCKCDCNHNTTDNRFRHIESIPVRILLSGNRSVEGPVSEINIRQRVSERTS